MSVTFEKISAEDSWRAFDRTAKRLLGISGKKFAERWDGGEYRTSDDVAVMRVAMMRPDGRHFQV